MSRRPSRKSQHDQSMLSVSQRGLPAALPKHASRIGHSFAASSGQVRHVSFWTRASEAWNRRQKRLEEEEKQKTYYERACDTTAKFISVSSFFIAVYRGHVHAKATREEKALHNRIVRIEEVLAQPYDPADSYSVWRHFWLIIGVCCDVDPERRSMHSRATFETWESSRVELHAVTSQACEHFRTFLHHDKGAHELVVMQELAAHYLKEVQAIIAGEQAKDTPQIHRHNLEREREEELRMIANLRNEFPRDVLQADVEVG